MIIKHVQENLCSVDRTLSYYVYKFGKRGFIPKNYCKILEYSCHGIPWLVIVTIICYTTEKNDFWLNLLVGLVFDIVYVAMAKAACRRRRPTYAVQDERAWISVDKLSFPSGHASRSIYVGLIFYQYSGILSLAIWLWAFMVITSRVLYGRHFVGDVLAGSILGYINYITQQTVLHPLHSFAKWFLLSLVSETINSDTF